MPIIYRKPMRPGTKPLIYFKGTLEDAERQWRQRIADAFHPEREMRKHNDGSYHPYDVPAQRMQKDIIKTMKLLKSWGETGRTRVIFPLTPHGILPVSITYYPSRDQFLVHQHPAVHGITSEFAFDALKTILAEGFRSGSGLSADKLYHPAPNAYVMDRKKGSQLAEPNKGNGFRGDCYSITLATPVIKPRLHLLDPSPIHLGEVNEVHVKGAPREQILGILIKLDKAITKEEEKKRKEFYRKELKGVPIKFVKD